MHHVRAFGAALLAGLVGCGLMLNFPGISDSTAATVGAVAAVAVWSAIMYHSKARVKHEEGTSSCLSVRSAERLKTVVAVLRPSEESEASLAKSDRSRLR